MTIERTRSIEMCDALDALEPLMIEARWSALWRRYMAVTVDSFLSTLPPEAQDWASAANMYDEGALSDDGLLAVRVRAWQVHDGLRATVNATTLSALRAVMCRLWPPKESDWHESASWFVDFCVAAGVAEAWMTELLHQTFGDVVGDTGRP